MENAGAEDRQKMREVVSGMRSYRLDGGRGRQRREMCVREKRERKGSQIHGAVKESVGRKRNWNKGEDESYKTITLGGLA